MHVYVNGDCGVETETINLELVSDLCTASPYIVWPRYLKMPNFKRQIIHRFIYFLFFFPPSFRRISLHLSIILHMKIESFYRLAKQLLKVFFFFFLKEKNFAPHRQQAFLQDRSVVLLFRNFIRPRVLLYILIEQKSNIR